MTQTFEILEIAIRCSSIFSSMILIMNETSSRVMKIIFRPRNYVLCGKPPLKNCSIPYRVSYRHQVLRSSRSTIKGFRLFSVL